MQQNSIDSLDNFSALAVGARLPATVLALFTLLAMPVFCDADAIHQIPLQIEKKEPRDKRIFTQGFVVDDDTFFVSSGLYNQSFIQRYPRAAPDKRENLSIPRQYFAEGLTIMGDSLYLITWKAGIAWRFNKETLQLLNTYRYSGEGWGLTHNGTELITSDGSHILTFREPQSFTPIKSISVTQNGSNVSELNELEYHDGIIWANQWRSHIIYGIDSDTGKVIAELNGEALLKEEGFYNRSGNRSSQNVLNGIAYDAYHDAFWVTGKRWQYRYLVKLPLPPTKTD
ncbi:glutaminyl-peptide cyclotransferase [Aurantivibrio plasticivorans]